MILQCSHIDKAFGTDVILSEVSFHINEQDKLAVVGANGCGKSTLLKIIVGELAPDSGNVIVSGGATLGYLAQNQDISSENTIYEEMLDAKKELVAMERELKEYEKKMNAASGEALDKMIARFTALTQDFETQGGYSFQSELSGVLRGLGFTETDYNTSIGTLSGGQKTRVALAKMLLAKPGIILLDEPTNHLDMASIAWLENYLSLYKGAVIIVAHDRYFLDKIVSKVVEIEYGKATLFTGNYSDYAVKKQALLESRQKEYENQQQEIKHQQEVIAKLRSFNREKSIKRAESREKMLNKMEILEKPITMTDTMHIRFEPGIVSGNDVLTVEGLAKSFGDKHLFSKLSFDMKRGERVAILGNNGTGKTTILKILNELLPADSGSFTLGTNVETAYYDQEHHVLHMEKTIFDELHDTYPDLNNTRIRTILAAFLFTGDDVFKRIGDLSGGERGRVSLAKLMLSDANFLILDEPTNHLDMASKEILEEALTNFSGTVLYVSHDRYFINKTATKILELANGQLYAFNGNYDYYLEKRDLVMGLSPAVGDESSAKDTKPEPANKTDWLQQKEQQKEERKRANQLQKIETRIEELEAEDARLSEELADPAIATDVAKLMEINAKKEAVNEELETCMEEWERLSE